VALVNFKTKIGEWHYAVNFPGKRQPTVGLDIYVLARLDIRYEESVVIRVVMKKDGLDFFCRVLYFLQFW
jgi:hypothetical protein